MPNTTTYNFGDIILVPFPFTDQTTSKKRPAVVVSSKAYNNDRPDIILMAVTSQMRHLGKTGEAEVANWKEAGLIKPSLMKPILTTIEKNLVLKKLGQLSQKDRHALQEILQTIIGKPQQFPEGAETMK